jgi:hypothetical protein
MRDPLNLRAQVEPAATLRTRFAEEGDAGFIFDSWLKSYASSRMAIALGAKYWDVGGAWVRAMVARSTVLVACDDEDPNVLLGWVACEPPERVHYVYVKHAARRLGVATGMLAAAGINKTDVRYSCAPGKKLRAIVGALGWRFEPVAWRVAA